MEKIKDEPYHKRMIVDCRTCDLFDECEGADRVFCIDLQYFWWIPKDKSLCMGCKMLHSVNKTCCKHAESCFLRPNLEMIIEDKK